MEENHWHWWHGIVSGNTPQFINASPRELIDHCIERHTLNLEASKQKRSLRKDPQLFEELKNEFMKKINFHKVHTYILEKSLSKGGSDVGLRILTTSPDHALLFEKTFSNQVEAPSQGYLFIYHDPDIVSIPVLTSIGREILIAGKMSASEILAQVELIAGKLKAGAPRPFD